ncbi:hypothetical protein CEXT_259871 [Caerostris extrusa]|uniref:Uncharacterized protein n=1 Tax=Caerostris extrusa TaxID=172846 RepID=A0AAV4UHC9_CAEEX|nr:hypothetical protein CEXT_259871 [Caerostris extrusa]
MRDTFIPPPEPNLSKLNGKSVRNQFPRDSRETPKAKNIRLLLKESRSFLSPTIHFQRYRRKTLNYRDGRSSAARYYRGTKMH